MITGTPRAAELVGDLVAAVDIGGHRGDADHVALQVEVDSSMFSSVSTTS